MVKYNNSKSLYDQYEELYNESQEQKQLLKANNRMISELTKTIERLNNSIDALNKIIKEKDEEILRLKSKNNRDSSNSSKPSGTNGFKKVITNRREKSTKSKGGQNGHSPHSLNNKLDKFINSGNVEEEIIEVNKNEQNKNKRYIEKVVIDIKITKHIKRYRYYPDKNGKYNIPKFHNQNVQYGSNVKAISIDLMNHLYNSTDGVTRFIEDITSGGITLSKGTLINWNSNMAQNLASELNHIELSLLDSYYLNHDESQIKINGNGYNILCACNNKWTRLWVSQHKSKDALKNIGFLPKFQGIIVKDGTELYNGFGVALSQCLSHIMRYLKPFYTDIKHKAPKKMSDFLSRCNTIRNSYIANGKQKFTDGEYNYFIKEYDDILNLWEKELRDDTDNYLFNDEYCLFRRMKYDNKILDENYRGDRDEILYFLKDFNVPSTNNAAEVAQRPTKIKQKIGKFRSEEGANDYATIRSCISTYKKNNINVLQALKNAFEGNTILV